MKKTIHPLRLLAKAVLFFVALNLLFAALNPPVEQWSVYNWIFPGRTRFPFGGGERTVSIDNLDVLFASHEISAPKRDNEFRVILIGDSSIWGDGVESSQTLSAYLNNAQLKCLEKDIRFYNLGFPHLAVMKDILFLNKAMAYQPDAIIWSFSLRTLLPKPPNPFLKANAGQIYPLLQQYHLNYPTEDFDYVRKTFWDKTFIGRRSELARIVFLQFLSAVWTSVGSDLSPAYAPQSAPSSGDEKSWNDLSDSIVYLGFEGPHEIRDSIWLSYITAGESIAGETPILFVNQPMFIATGKNSDLRYNEAYPRWAYDQYRAIMLEQAAVYQRRYLDLWDTIPAVYFTGETFHLSPQGEALLAQEVGAGFVQQICGQ